MINRPDNWVSELFHYLRRHINSFLLATVSAITGAALAAAIPVIEQRIVDQLNAEKFDALATSLCVFLGAGTARAITEVVRHYSGARTALSVQRDIRDDLVKSVHQFDTGQIRDIGPGHILESATRDADLVEGLLDPLPRALGNILLTGAALAVMVTMSPSLTLVVIAILPITYLSISLSRKKIFSVAQHAQSRSADLTRMVAERVSGVEVIKSYGQEEAEAARIRSVSVDVFTQKMRFVHLSAGFSSFMNVVPLLGQVAVFGVGCVMVVTGSITLGTLVAFVSFGNQLVNSSRVLTGLAGFFFDAKAGIVRALTLINTTSALESGTTELAQFDAKPVELERVSFEVDRDMAPILNDLSLQMEAGSLTVLVGTVGSGKSTVFELIARAFDPTSGAIKIAGIDVRDLDVTSLRRSVVPVYEDPALFPGTVLDNISCGDDNISLDGIRAAARFARADEFIMEMPDGYASLVGEDGTNLSGGQRQRLALARAFARKPDVLLLDNPTSAMDAETSARVHDFVRKSMNHVTRIVVTDRLDMLRAADQIHVLDQARIIDSGDHNELIARCERYRDLVNHSESAKDRDCRNVDYRSAPTSSEM